MEGIETSRFMLDHDLLAPDLLKQGILGHNMASMTSEIGEEAILGGSKHDLMHTKSWAVRDSNSHGSSPTDPKSVLSTSFSNRPLC